MKEELNFILSPETEEEKRDMILMMNEWGTSYLLYSRFFNKKIRYLSKMIDCILFLFFVTKNAGKNTAILAAPCLRNRIASLILSKKYIMYLRCLHSNGENLSFLSDKIDFFMKKFGINSKLTNPYIADVHLITSQQTKRFLSFRKADRKVIDIGAIWLKDVKLKKAVNQNKRVYFISQAFAEHNFVEPQQEQVDFVKLLKSNVEKMGMELIIKNHPRDYYSYDGYTLFNGDAEDLINTVSEDDIVISFFSTLGFELSLIGADVKFVSLKSLSDIYPPLYQQNNIKFYENFNDDFSFLLSKKISYKIFSPIYLSGINLNDFF